MSNAPRTSNRRDRPQEHFRTLIRLPDSCSLFQSHESTQARKSTQALSHARTQLNPARTHARTQDTWSSECSGWVGSSGSKSRERSSLRTITTMIGRRGAPTIVEC